MGSVLTITIALHSVMISLCVSQSSESPKPVGVASKKIARICCIEIDAEEANYEASRPHHG